MILGSPSAVDVIPLFSDFFCCSWEIIIPLYFISLSSVTVSDLLIVFVVLGFKDCKSAFAFLFFTLLGIVDSLNMKISSFYFSFQNLIQHLGLLTLSFMSLSFLLCSSSLSLRVAFWMCLHIHFLFTDSLTMSLFCHWVFSFYYIL